MNKVNYTVDVLLGTSEHKTETIIINNNKDNKTSYAEYTDNREKAVLHNDGFSKGASITTEQNSISLTFDYMLQNNSTVHNIGKANYIPVWNFESLNNTVFETKFGENNVMALDLEDQNIVVATFVRYGSWVGIHQTYSKYEYHGSNDKYYDFIDGTLYISETNPKAYGPITITKTQFDNIGTEPITDWSYLNNFQYIPKSSIQELNYNSLTFVLAARYFPLYENGTVVIKHGDTFEGISVQSVDHLRGFIYISQDDLPVAIEEIDGFYILYGATACVLTNVESIKTNISNGKSDDDYSFIGIDNEVLDNLIVASSLEVNLHKSTVSDVQQISILPSELNIFLEPSQSLNIDSENTASRVYFNCKRGRLISLDAPHDERTLLTNIPGISTTVTLPSYWDGNAVALYGKFGNEYVLMTSNCNPNTIPYDASLVKTVQFNIVPSSNGYDLITSEWYIPSTVVVEKEISVGNYIALQVDVDYYLQYPDKIIIKDNQSNLNLTHRITFDSAVQYIPESVNTLLNTIKYKAYDNIWTIYDSQNSGLQGLYFMAANEVLISIGYSDESGSDIFNSQQITVHINTTQNFLEQSLIGFKGTI